MHSPAIGYYFVLFDIHIIQNTQPFSRCSGHVEYIILKHIMGFPFVKDLKVCVAEQSTEAAAVKCLIAMFIPFSSLFYSYG